VGPEIGDVDPVAGRLVTSCHFCVHTDPPSGLPADTVVIPIRDAGDRHVITVARRHRTD
jgi:hypothetical protein